MSNSIHISPVRAVRKVGMGKELAEQYPVPPKRVFDEVDEAHW